MSEQTEVIEALQEQIRIQKSMIAVYEGMARSVHTHAADAGWSGGNDFDAMLRAIREQGRHEGADAAREAARAAVKWHGDRALKFFAASSDKDERSTYAASMRVLRLALEDIEKIPRPEKTWHAIPNDSGLWWFARHDGEMSLVWQTHTGVITTLWGKQVGDLDDGQWARAVVPASPYGRRQPPSEGGSGSGGASGAAGGSSGAGGSSATSGGASSGTS